MGMAAQLGVFSLLIFHLEGQKLVDSKVFASWVDELAKQTEDPTQQAILHNLSRMLRDPRHFHGPRVVEDHSQ